MADTSEGLGPVELATELTSAWLTNPNTIASSDDVSAFLRKIHAAITGLGQPVAEAPAVESEHFPAVTVRKSLASKTHLISLIDGKPYKTLTRHLKTHGLTPAEYRTRYGLKDDYPMVSPAYSTYRRDLANKLGLGRKSKSVAKPVAPEPAPAAKPSRGRPKSG